MHTWESEFRRDVASWLIDSGYRVRSNVYLDCRRWVDLVAEGEFATFAIEVENDFDSAFEGVGQAAVYAEGIASDYPNKPVYPAVVVPRNHLQEPERTWLSRYIPVYPV